MIKYEIELISPQVDGTEISTVLISNLGHSDDERLDELLDIFNIEVWNRSREPFSMLDSIRIKATDELDNDFFTDYSISDDVPVLIGKNPLIYEHTLSLIELTKTLDGFTLPSSTFTQPIDKSILRYPTLSSMYDRTINIYNVETDEFFPQTRRYSLDPNVRAIFDTIVPAQIFPKEPTLREQLNEIGKQADAIVRLLPGNIITYDFLNVAVINVNIEDSEIIDYRARQSLEFYGTTIESTAKNVVNDGTENNIPVLFPPDKAWTTIRSSDIIIDENLAAINIPGLPFYQINKFLVKARSDNVEHDIIDYLAEEKAYQTLPTDGWNNLVVQTGNFKQNTLQYTFNGNQIFGFGNEFKTGPLFLFTTAVWIEAFRSAGVPIEQNLTDYLFKIEYIPIIKDDRFRMEREDIDIINKRYMFKSNQQDRINEFSKFGKNISGQIQRLGNQSIELTVLGNDLSKLHSINTYVLNYKAIITEREIRFFRWHYLVTYRLDINFNRIARFVGVDAERRETDIIVDKDTSFRNLVYEDYITVNLDGIENNNSHLTDLGFQYMVETLKGTIRRGINNVHLVTDESGSLIITVVPKGARSILKHTFVFDNPVFAGDLVVNNLLTSGISNFRDTEKGARYTRQDGTFDRMSLEYGVSYGNALNTFEEDEEIGRNLPYVDPNQLGNDPLIRVGNIINGGVTLENIIKIETQSLSDEKTKTFTGYLESIVFTILVKQSGVPTNPSTAGKIDFSVVIDGGQNIFRTFTIDKLSETFTFPVNRNVGTEYSYFFIATSELNTFSVETSPITTTLNIPDIEDSLQVYKDPAEIIGGEMLTHILPGKSDLGEVIIGDSFCEFNNLVGGGLVGTVFVYGTQDRYQKFQKINVKNDVVLGAANDITLSNNNLRLTVDIELIANQSWAIGTSAGKMLMAFNPPRTIDNSAFVPKVVSFDGQHLRPGVIYNLNDPDIPTIPAAPSNFNGFAQTVTEIRLTWNDNSNNETGFELWMQEDGGPFVNQEILAADSTEFTYVNLIPDTLYNFRIRSFNDDGSSQYVLTSAETVISKTADPSISIVEVTATSITFKVLNRDSDSATIFANIDLPIPITNRGIITTFNFTGDIEISGLEPSTSYDIFAKASAQGKEQSDVISVNQNTTTAARTSTPDIESISTTENSISWKVRNNDASTASIFSELGFVDPDVFRGNVTSDNTTGTITVGGLSPDTQYTIAASADAIGKLDSLTRHVNATTDPLSPPLAPSNVSLSGVVDGLDINLSATWNDNSDNETGFELQLELSGGGFSPLTTVGANVERYDFQSIAGATYKVRVRSVNSSGESAWVNSNLVT